MYLGEIFVPSTEDWVPGITYRPEPPIVIRGSMNPWADERKREVWLAEEAAWKKITALQGTWRELRKQEAEHMREIQHWLRDMERLTGKKSGISSAANYGALLYSVSGGPYAWAAAIGKFGIDMILGIGKKKQAKSIMRKLEDLGAKMMLVQTRMNETAKALEPLVRVGAAVKDTQKTRTAQDLQKSETLYASRALRDREQGAQHAALVRYYANQQPARQGSNNEL